MKRYTFYLCLALLVSCGKTSETEKYQRERNNIVDVSGRISDIKVDLMIGMSSLYTIDSFLVVQEWSPAGEKGIHIFNKNSFNQITSTGIIGKGPREITRQGKIGINYKTGVLWVNDHGKRVMWKFPLDSILTNPNFMPTENIDIPLKFFIEQYGFVNDSIAIGKAVRVISTSSFNNKMSKFNLIKNSTTSFGYEHPDVTETQSLFTFALSVKDSLYINGYSACDLMTICDLNGNLKYNIYGPDWNTNKQEWRDYYTSIGILNNHIIASFVGQDRFYYDKNSRLQTNWPTKFMVFDLEGNYEATLETGCPFIAFCVDEDNNRIIVYFDGRENPLAYFNFKIN